MTVFIKQADYLKKTKKKSCFYPQTFTKEPTPTGFVHFTSKTLVALRGFCSACRLVTLAGSKK